MQTQTRIDLVQQHSLLGMPIHKIFLNYQHPLDCAVHSCQVFIFKIYKCQRLGITFFVSCTQLSTVLIYLCSQILKGTLYSAKILSIFYCSIILICQYAILMGCFTLAYTVTQTVLKCGKQCRRVIIM